MAELGFLKGLQIKNAKGRQHNIQRGRLGASLEEA